jgi:superfamily I DNA/RNA helicase
MVSKSTNNTEFSPYSEIINQPYVYLFRSWRMLLQTAEKSPKKIWIYGYDKKINEIRYLHKKVTNKYHKMDEDEDEYEDDLPKFLSSLTADELEEMLSNISNNVVDFKSSDCKMYTIHSYKGMENDYIRISNDIDIEKEDNLYYVALTRGMKKIVTD